MATLAAIGHGTTFAKSDMGGTPVYTALADVISIEGPGLTRDTVDATHMGSTERFREFVGGLRDAGEVTIELNFDPGGTAQIALVASYRSDSAINYRITFPDATIWEFAAFVTSISPTTPLDDKMTLSAGFKLTGKPAFMT
jgi:hypothetical protein